MKCGLPKLSNEILCAVREVDVALLIDGNILHIDEPICTYI